MRTMVSARDWILVLFGRFIRARGGWVSVRQLVEMLDALGSDAASTRTAVSRMKRSGFIAAETRDTLAGYRLTEDGEVFFADGDRRVVERSVPDGRWVLASFSVPESQRKVRYQIRTRLTDLGFGQESAGLLLAPAGLTAEAERTLRRAQLDSWVSLWVADFGSLGDISEVVSRTWDLDRLGSGYALYVSNASDALERSHGDDADVFVQYMRLNNAWRELRYLDPGLPADACGDRWPQPRAADLAEEVERRLRPAADRHYDAVTAGLRTMETT